MESQKPEGACSAVDSAREGGEQLLQTYRDIFHLHCRQEQAHQASEDVDSGLAQDLSDRIGQ